MGVWDLFTDVTWVQFLFLDLTISKSFIEFIYYDMNKYQTSIYRSYGGYI